MDLSCLKVCNSGNFLIESPSLKLPLRLELAVPLGTFLALGQAAEAEHFSIAVKRLPIASS